MALQQHIEIGSCVTVAPLFGPGIYQEGGVARILRIGPDGNTVDVKYVLTNTVQHGVGVNRLRDGSMSDEMDRKSRKTRVGLGALFESPEDAHDIEIYSQSEIVFYNPPDRSGRKRKNEKSDSKPACNHMEPSWDSSISRKRTDESLFGDMIPLDPDMASAWTSKLMSDCSICGQVKLESTVSCMDCGVSVHFSCTSTAVTNFVKKRRHRQTWMCEPCQRDVPIEDRQCFLCPRTDGAMFLGAFQKLMHYCCSRWTMSCENHQQATLMALGTEKCYICHQSNGLCLPCGMDCCSLKFHASCALDCGILPPTTCFHHGLDSHQPQSFPASSQLDFEEDVIKPVRVVDEIENNEHNPTEKKVKVIELLDEEDEIPKSKKRKIVTSEAIKLAAIPSKAIAYIRNSVATRFQGLGSLLRINSIDDADIFQGVDIIASSQTCITIVSQAQVHRHLDELIQTIEGLFDHFTNPVVIVNCLNDIDLQLVSTDFASNFVQLNALTMSFLARNMREVTTLVKDIVHQENQHGRSLVSLELFDFQRYRPFVRFLQSLRGMNLAAVAHLLMINKGKCLGDILRQLVSPRKLTEKPIHFNMPQASKVSSHLGRNFRHVSP